MRERLLLPLLLAVAGVSLLWLMLSASASSTQSRLGNVALGYARQQMEWISGPTLVSVHILPLRRLQPALRQDVASSVAVDLNVPDLQRRFGARREVALAVLSGVYNSLPPDEGVNVRGEVVALVDVKTSRVLLLSA